MVVDAATIVLKAMRARLPVTTSTGGGDSCMKLQWIRKLLLEWVGTLDGFDESLLSTTGRFGASFARPRTRASRFARRQR